MKTRILSALLVLGLAGCFYPSDRGKALEARVDKLDADNKDLAAQLTQERDALKQQAAQLQAQVGELQGRLDKLDKASRTSDADVGVQIQTVRDDLAQLRGAVDQYQHRIDLIDQGLKQLSDQTDQKIAGLQGSDALKKLQTQKEVAQLQRPADKGEFLKLAESKANAGDADVAMQLYREWLQKWPKDPAAATAHYNLGKLYQDAHREREALAEYGEVVKGFPKSPQYPPALLRSSESFAALGMEEQSHTALEVLVQKFPQSQEGKIAKERLKKPAKPAAKKKGGK